MARAQAGSCRFFVRSRSFLPDEHRKEPAFCIGCAGMCGRFCAEAGRRFAGCFCGMAGRFCHARPARGKGMRMKDRPLQRRDAAECAWMLARCDDGMQPDARGCSPVATTECSRLYAKGNGRIFPKPGSGRRAGKAGFCEPYGGRV